MTLGQVTFGTYYCFKDLSHVGESMKKKTSHAKVKAFSKDCISHGSFLLVYIAFFTQLLKLNLKFEAKYDI
jgi:hypothetical protein